MIDPEFKVQINEKIDPTVWNTFVGESVFHRFEWFDVVGQCYGYKPFFALCHNESQFALIASFKTGKTLYSLAHTYISGPLYNSLEMWTALSDYIRRENLKIKFLKLEAPTDDNRLTAIVEFEKIDSYFGSLSSNMRNQIRKSQKIGFQLEQETSTENFYDIISTVSHSHGTPSHSKKFYDLLLNYLPQHRIYTVFYNDRAVGSMLTVENVDPRSGKRELVSLQAGVLPEFSHLYVNYFMYWEIFREAERRAIRKLDLGACFKDSGPYQFKQKFKPKFLAIKSMDTEGALYPKGYYKENKWLVFVASLWKKMPLALARLLGPYLRKHLP